MICIVFLSKLVLGIRVSYKGGGQLWNWSKRPITIDPTLDQIFLRVFNIIFRLEFRVRKRWKIKLVMFIACSRFFSLSSP